MVVGDKMRPKKMWCLVIRIKKNDTVKGKRASDLILDILKKGGVSGAMVWTGMDGYGKRGKSTLHIEGITINMPLAIEVIEELPKLENVLPDIKELLHDHGVITLHEVGMI
jgi:PII-like signaling protein